MARNLRDNIRKYSEPIEIVTKTEEIINGYVRLKDNETIKAMASIFENKDMNSNNNSSQVPTEEIILEIKVGGKAKISDKLIPNVTEIRVFSLNYLYKVTRISQFNINSESIIVAARRIV